MTDVIMKRIISIITAAVFVMGTACFDIADGTRSVYAADANQTASSQVAQKGGNYVEGQVIVGYIDTADMELTRAQENRADKALDESEELMTCEDVDVDDVDVSQSKLSDEVVEDETVDETLALVESDAKSTEQLMEEISKLPNVDYVEPNYVFTVDGAPETGTDSNGENVAIAGAGTGSAAGPAGSATESGSSIATASTSDYTSEQWAYNGSSDYGAGIPNWNNSSKKNAEGTVVAVIDSGVDYNHEDLKNVMWDDGENYKSLKKLGGGKYGIDVVDGDSNPFPKNSDHGTHCAGIIAAQWNGIGVSGGANGTEIMAVKATYRNKGDVTDSLNLDDVIEAFKYVMAAEEAGVNVTAINASWGGIVGEDSGKSLEKIVNQAGKKCNIVTVFASCNNGTDCDKKTVYGSYYLIHYLKDCPYKIVVNSNTKSGKRASSSNYGKATTDVFAPGDSILSTIRTSSGAYGTMGGTSMATPVVTAEVAILAARKSGMAAAQIVKTIKAGVTPVAAFADLCTSGGIINVEKTLKLSESRIELYDFTLSGTTFYYDGTSKEPEVICSQLTEGTDYSVSYQSSNSGSDSEDCIVPGKYKAIITGMGSYSGTVELTYSIKVRPTVISGISRGLRSFTVTATQRPEDLVSGYQTRYSLYSSMKKAVTKTIGTAYDRTSKKITGLKKNRKYYVQVRTYRAINGEKYYSTWSSRKTVKTK